MQSFNPNQPPEDGVSPQDMRLIELQAQPWPEDSRRVRITLEITPFLERPDLHVQIQDMQGTEISSITIIESIDSRMTFTMHIREERLAEDYQLTGSIQYADHGIVDQKTIPFKTNSTAG